MRTWGWRYLSSDETFFPLRKSLRDASIGVVSTVLMPRRLRGRSGMRRLHKAAALAPRPFGAQHGLRFTHHRRLAAHLTVAPVKEANGSRQVHVRARGDDPSRIGKQAIHDGAQLAKARASQGWGALVSFGSVGHRCPHGRGHGLAEPAAGAHVSVIRYEPLRMLPREGGGAQQGAAARRSVD